MNNQSKVQEEKKHRKTILIFGVSGFVGSNLAEFFKNDYKVVGTYHKNPVRIPGVLTLPCDVLTKEEVQLVLFAFKPDITLYCVGMPSIVDCSKSEELADALNTSGLFNVAEYCQRYKSQICYLSSSFVFSGDKKSYIEMDIPDPSTLYGKTQAAAEFYIQKTSLNYVIFRICKLYGRGVNPMKPTEFEKIQRHYKAGKNLSLDGYIKTGYLDIFYLGMILKLCFEKGVMNRLFQISSTDHMSLFDFGKLYAKYFNEPTEAVTKGKWHLPTLNTFTIPIEEFNFKLDIANIEGFLNIQLPTIEESIEFTFKKLNGNEKASSKVSKGDGLTYI